MRGLQFGSGGLFSRWAEGLHIPSLTGFLHPTPSLSEANLPDEKKAANPAPASDQAKLAEAERRAREALCKHEKTRNGQLRDSDVWLLPKERTGEARYLTAAERQNRRAFSHHDEFKRHSEPFTIPGSTEIVMIDYSGLMTTHYPMKNPAVQTSRRFGYWTTAHSLYGNDGSRTGVRVTSREMIDYLDNVVQDTKRLTYNHTRPPALGWGFSAGSLAMAQLQAEKPGTFSALELSATPLFLQSRIDTVMLEGALRIDKAFQAVKGFADSVRREFLYFTRDGWPRLNRCLHAAAAVSEKVAQAVSNSEEWFKNLVIPDFATSRIGRFVKDLQFWKKETIKEPDIFDSKAMRKNPYVRETTVGNYIAFWELRNMVIRSFKEGKISGPIQITLAADDKRVRSADTKRFIDQCFRSEAYRKVDEANGFTPERSCTILSNSPHTIFLGPNAQAFNQRMWSFWARNIKRLKPDQPEPDYSRPHFKMLEDGNRRPRRSA